MTNYLKGFSFTTFEADAIGKSAAYFTSTFVCAELEMHQDLKFYENIYFNLYILMRTVNVEATKIIQIICIHFHPNSYQHNQLLVYSEQME